MVPEKIDNILSGSGKGVSAVPQTMLRYQSAGMALGQAAGVAAAIASAENIHVRNVDIRKVQKELLRQGVYLGDEKRLAELELI